MRTISWILLTIGTLIVLLGSVGSAFIAYTAPESMDIIVASSSTSLEDLGLSDEVSTALRGRRGTAAAYALGFASLMLWVILGPYRKGEVWAWWAILSSTLLLAVLAMLRIPAIGLTQGAMNGLYLLIVVVIGLLLDIRRLSARQSE